MKRLLAFAFVLAAGVAGTAGASPPRPTVFSSLGVDVITYPAAEPGYMFITDTLGGDGGHSWHAAARHPAARPERGYTVITDTLAPGGAPAPTVSHRTGFNWPDAGIGAAAGAGVLLAVAGLGLLVVRRRVPLGA